VAVSAILFLNKTNVSGAIPSVVEDRRDVALRFWKEVNKIKDFGAEGAKEKTIAAQPVVLKALAKLTYDFAFGKGQSEANLEKLLNGISKIDFSHKNPTWRYYDLIPEDRERYAVKGLNQYLPADTEGKNRDIGKYDEHAGVMRFGSKHNDIFPILGDMIRWKLGLPNRQKSPS
jgi:DNA-sulfur modification-associated